MINRLLLFWLTIMLLSCQHQSTPTPDGPNMIFILTDDQRWDALGVAGNTIIQTPEMDRLAQEGAFFQQAFVTTPICAASRASIITGLYERTHGFTFGTPPLSPRWTRQSYPALLHQAGYKTGFVGKWGMKISEQLEEELFDYVERPSERGRWNGNYFAIQDDHSHKHLTHEIADLSIKFIDSLGRQGPFCLSISFHAPHAHDGNPAQYIYPERLDDLYMDDSIPPFMTASHEDPYPPVMDGLNYRRWLWRFNTPEKFQKMVKSYYRMITGIDQQIGRIREILDTLDMADNTIIILMSDNGYFLNERNMAGKWLMYDNCLRVPLVVYDPTGAIPPGTYEKEMTLNIDIAPTLLTYAGISAPEHMQGISIQNIARGVDHRDHFICEHLFDHKWIPQSEGIRTENYKYFRYRDTRWEELYDLVHDPQETTNLIHDTDHHDVVHDLRSRLDDQLINLELKK